MPLVWSTYDDDLPMFTVVMIDFFLGLFCLRLGLFLVLLADDDF